MSLYSAIDLMTLYSTADLIRADSAVDVMSAVSAIDVMSAVSAVDVMSAVSAVDVMSADSVVDRVSLDSNGDVLPRDLDNGGKGINVAHFSGVVIGGAVYIDTCCSAMKAGFLNPLGIVAPVPGTVDPVVGIVAPSTVTVTSGVEIAFPVAGFVDLVEGNVLEAVADTVWGRPEEAVVDDVNDRVPIVKLFVVENFVAAVFFCSIFYSRTNHGITNSPTFVLLLILLFQPQHKRIEVPQKSVAIQFLNFIT
ncbi:hypothetical protein TNCT_424251 [Trichonephila clavata]|uniref:Uncharacterized protein n=1 Tax=Trichonephila clavata TaxID=2740835 RepID=A0A8X6EXJ7_TRICU|nr:hypothetical protein TNCT_424251 [Trichonephila clavata]